MLHLRTSRRWLLGAAMGAMLGSAAMQPALAAAPDPARPAAWCEPRCGDLISSWSLTAYAVIRADNEYQNPLPATRALTMMHLAMHDAINGAVARYARYASTANDTQADPALAAVIAAHRTLLSLYPSQKPLLDARLTETLIEAGTGAHVERAVALGEAAARHVIAKRAADGSDQAVSYQQGTRPGEYRFVPGTTFIVAPQWKSVQPFGLRSADQFRVAPPPSLVSADYASAFNEVKRLGGKSGAARTKDQSDYAAFWYELSDIGWNRVARTVARERNLDLWSSARLFALLNIAMADGYIAGWDSKLHYNFWRPVTAIRLAADDGNANTAPDKQWESFLPTPPIQDHPSTHSVLGSAAAEVLTAVIGDQTEFAVTSGSAVADNPVRRFYSFREAARENGMSRIMAGLHFSFAVEAGLKLGEQIGRHVVTQHLHHVQVN